MQPEQERPHLIRPDGAEGQSTNAHHDLAEFQEGGFSSQPPPPPRRHDLNPNKRPGKHSHLIGPDGAEGQSSNAHHDVVACHEDGQTVRDRTRRAVALHAPFLLAHHAL